MKDHADDHDQGLTKDLETLRRAMLGRRQALFALAAAGFAPLVACEVEVNDGSGGSGGSGGATTGSTPETCEEVPDETGGPYPGDGSNGPNALTASGIVRSDITSSFGSMSGTAAGIPLTIKMQLLGVDSSCKALAGYAVYIWHCDQDGNYSLYTVPTENYLRGVQAADASGTVTFQSIFPGCYSGRWPHIHFEIYESLADATAAGAKVKTSQIALPEEACDEAYAASGYASSATNLTMTSLTEDMVFSDGVTLELATVTGDPTNGYVLTIAVGVSA